MSTAIQLFKETNDTLLMQADALGAHVSAGDRRIILAATEKPVRAYNDRELSEACVALVRGIMRNIGIVRQPDAFDGAQFMLTLREDFPDLTLEDVSNAFRLFNLGDLDAWLKKDSKGQPIDHYQQFSQRFYIAVLRAYKSKQLDAKHAVAGKVAYMLTAKSEEERDPHADRASTILVIKAICVDIASGKSPTYICTGLMEHVAWRAKLLPDTFQVTDDDRSRAKVKYLKRKDSAVAIAVHNVLKAGGVHDELETKARDVAVRRILESTCRQLGPEEVARRFDWLAERERSKIKSAS